jgi:hypothetical protein
MGAALTSHPDDLDERIEKWLPWKRGEKDFEELFPDDKDRLLWIGEMKSLGKKQRRFQRFKTLTPEQAQKALKDKIELKNGHTALYDCHGHKSQDNPETFAIKRIHGAKTVLTAEVRNVGRRERGDPEFHRVRITGPYEHNAEIWSELDDNSRDSFFGSMKKGRAKCHVATTSIGALVNYVLENPRSMETFIRLRQELRKQGQKIDVFNPFYTDRVRDEVLAYFKPEELLHIAKGDQPLLEALQIDVLKAYFIDGLSFAEIGKRLLRTPITNPILIEAIKKREATCDILPNSQLFGVDSNVAKAVRQAYWAMRRKAERRELKIDGYCYEKKDSPYESGALVFRSTPVFQNRFQEDRFIFNEKYPPVLIKRYPMHNARVHPFKERPKSRRAKFSDLQEHPFSELYLDPFKTRRFDDRRREFTFLTGELPEYIPNDLLKQYAREIMRHFPGRMEEFVRMCETARRLIPGEGRVDISRVVDLPRSPLVKRLVRASKSLTSTDLYINKEERAAYERETGKKG